jgi:hypothetical protein
MRSATAIATQSRNLVTATLRFKAPLTNSDLVFWRMQGHVMLCHAVRPAVSSKLDGTTSISLAHGVLPAILSVLCTTQAEMA